MADEDLFADVIFAGEGASVLTWEVGTRCSCYSPDSRQPDWQHVPCGGLGAIYAAPVPVRGLLRGQSRWTSHRVSGEHGLGEAQLTTPVSVKPGYTDMRIRDRFTVVAATGDFAPGRIFYPAAEAIPFLFDGVQMAWRVQLQSMEQATRGKPQP